MKLNKTAVAAAALTLAAGPNAVSAQLADDITLVSWGGAYQKSQHRAYVEPYIAKFHECSHPISRKVAPTSARRRPCRESKTVLAAAVPRM